MAPELSSGYGGDGDGDCDGTRIITDIHIDLWAYKEGVDVFVSGEITYDFASPCSLCLTEVSGSQTTQVSIRFKRSNKAIESGEEIDYYAYSRDVIELDDYLRELIVMDMPLKTVCSGECKGLCGVCGVNLNVERCGCSREWSDPRFEVLKGLKF